MAKTFSGWINGEQTVVEVSDTGVITAVRKGSAVITYTDQNNKTNQYTINVIPGEADSDRFIIIGQGEGFRGDEMPVDIRLANTEGITSGEFTILYDNTRLTAVSAEAGECISGDGTHVYLSDAAGAVRVIFSGISQAQEEGDNDGDVLLKLRLKIKDNSLYGKTAISAARAVFNLDDGKSVSGKSAYGTVLVKYTDKDSLLSLSNDKVTLQRDYSQIVDVSVKNLTDDPVHYYLQAENPYEDIYLNFVDSGSDLAPITINGKEILHINLSVFLQNAQREEYSIPVKVMVEKNGVFVENGSVNVDFYCHIPVLDIDFKTAEINGSTLETKYTLSNNGDSITDLTLRIEGDAADYVRFENTFNNYRFNSGQQITAILSPDLTAMKEDSLTRVEGKLVASGAGKELAYDISFNTGGKEIHSLKSGRVAMMQDGNPYYDIECTSSSTNMDEMNAEKLQSFVKENGDFTLSATRNYLYSGGSGTVTVEIIVGGKGTTSQEYPQGLTVDKEKGTVVNCSTVEIDSKDSYDWAVEILNAIGDQFNLKKDAAAAVDRLVLGEVPKEVTVMTYVTDGIFKILDADNRAKSFMNIYKGLSYVSDGFGYLSDLADATSLFANPDVSEDDAQGYLLLKLAENIVGIPSDPTGRVFGTTMKYGFKLLENMHKTLIGEGPLSEYSNDELGNYIHQLVNGVQCTNAGKVTCNAPLARGMKGFGAYMEIYRRLGSGQLDSRNILQSLGYKSRGSVKGSDDSDGDGQQEAAFMYITARMASGSHDFTNRVKGHYYIQVNDTYMGSIETDGVTEVTGFGLFTDELNTGSNTIVRSYDTNPGSHRVVAETEINTYVPEDAVLSFIGSADEYMDITPHPDFAVYPENIYVSDEYGDSTTAVSGSESKIAVNVYNRGQRGGWTDIVIYDGDDEIYREENAYISAFGKHAISADWIPSTRSSAKIRVILDNKTRYADEIKLGNNDAEMTFPVRQKVIPEVKGIYPDRIELLNGSDTIQISADVSNISDIVSAEFAIDGNAISQDTKFADYQNGRRYSAEVSGELLNEGTHEISLTINYKASSEQIRSVSSTSEIVVTYHNCEKQGHIMKTLEGSDWICDDCGARCKDIGSAEITLQYYNIEYTGNPAVPAVTVKYDGNTLKEETDYVISYTDNTSIGVAKVTVAGRGEYCGSVQLSFTIGSEEQIDDCDHDYDSETTPADCIHDGYTTYICKLCGKMYVEPDEKALGHSWDDGTVTVAPGCDNDGIITCLCTRCGETRTDVIPHKEHKWGGWVVVTKPTYTNEGKEQRRCSNCEAVEERTIARLTPQSITKATVTGVVSMTYTGRAIKQTPVVTLKGKTLNSGTDYIVKYKNNTYAGTAAVTITGTGNFKGSITATFTIKKADQTIKAKAAASSIAVGRTTTVSTTGNKGSVTYKSSNTTIATVAKSTGKVTAKKVGTVKITATSAATDNFKSASKTVTINVVPAATTLLTASNLAAGIRLNWKKVAGAKGYKVYRGTSLYKTITSGSTVTYTDTKASTNGTKYTYKVIATAATGPSTLSKSVAAYRVARPAISSATNSATGRMTVKWGRNTKATGYQVQYCLNKSFSSGNKAATIKSNKTVSKTIGSLTKGKMYYVRVRSYKTVSGKNHYSAWSVVKAVKVKK